MKIWQYGDSGRIRREYKYNEKYFLESKSDPEIGTNHYTYDLVGNLKSSQVEEFRTTTNEYDDLDRLTFVDYPGSTLDTDFSYDDNGNLTGLIAGESSWSYQYDNNNNLTDEILTINSDISRSYAFHYDYNTLDFLAGITYPNSLYIDYAPNNLGRPTKVGSYAENVSYYPSGQIESFTYGNGKVAQFTLNQRLFPETVSVDGLVDLTYSYDDTGNVTSIIDAINSSQNVLMDQAGSYDGINRLRQVSGPWGTLDYSYNTFGDIQTRSLDGTSSNYFYRNAKLKQLRNNAELKFMDFDPLGNVTRKSQYDLNSSGYVSEHDTKSYRYDHASRLVAAITGGSTKNYFYDGNGHRYLERIKGSYQNSFSVYTQTGTLLFEEEFAECSTKSYIRLGDLLVAQSVDQEMDSELDTDADSISDCLETRLGLAPNDPQDATLDSDGDGLTNLEEVAQGTLLFSVDTDGDGVSDGDEVALQETDPLLADTDDDGINDSDETAAGSNLLLYDSDHDGVNDGDEQAFGLNALDPDDGRLDLDEDGYSNRQKASPAPT
ncbi:hypothetical protein [Microbulbifer halophilus]|uniref:hypothetical protein n=1 Tax=Microbulbifer halophilus TaxID=453963 RepID=UPI00361AA1A2